MHSIFGAHKNTDFLFAFSVYLKELKIFSSGKFFDAKINRMRIRIDWWMVVDNYFIIFVFYNLFCGHGLRSYFAYFGSHKWNLCFYVLWYSSFVVFLFSWFKTTMQQMVKIKLLTEKNFNSNIYSRSSTPHGSLRTKLYHRFLLI